MQMAGYRNLHDAKLHGKHVVLHSFCFQYMNYAHMLHQTSVPKGLRCLMVPITDETRVQDWQCNV